MFTGQKSNDRFDRLCFSRYNPRSREAPRANISLNPADIRREQQHTTVERFVITRDRRYVVVAHVYISFERAIPRSGRAWSGKRELRLSSSRWKTVHADSRSVPIACHSRGERKLRASCFRVRVNCDRLWLTSFARSRWRQQRQRLLPATPRRRHQDFCNPSLIHAKEMQIKRYNFLSILLKIKVPSPLNF